jgi:hypothetical protein
MPGRSGLIAGGSVLLALVAAGPAAAQYQESPVTGDMSGSARIDITWTMADSSLSPSFGVADPTGARLGVRCAATADSPPGDLPCVQYGTNGGKVIPSAHWAGQGNPAHLAFIDEDPAAGRHFCLDGFSYSRQVSGTATFTDPDGSRRAVSFSSDGTSPMTLIGATPVDPQWEPNCFYHPGVPQEAPPAEQIPAQSLRLTSTGKVKVKIGRSRAFGATLPTSVTVTLRTAPTKSSSKKALTLGKATGGLSSFSNSTVVVKLTRAGLRALAHRPSLRVGIQALATGGSGGFAFAQLDARNAKRALER